METPITPPPYQPIPAPVTPSVSVMPPAKPASSMRWLWIALVAVVVFAGAAYGWMTLYPSSSDQQATPSPSSTASPVVNAPGVETFTSQALGIRFDYLTDQGSPVIEEGDTVYIGGKGGQWVRVFTKAPGDNLQTAITKRFLAGVPAGKCIVSITAEDKNPDILFGNINVDFEPTDPGDPRLASSPCPAEYRVTNGIRYFYMDTAHPDRFFFFSIGQYAIPAEPIGTKDGKTWQDTFEVLDLSPTAAPTAGWKTYTNVKYGFEFKYPTAWPTPKESMEEVNVIGELGPVQKGACEGVDCYFYGFSVNSAPLSAFGADALETPERLLEYISKNNNPGDSARVISDVSQNNVRTISWETAGGIGIEAKRFDIFQPATSRTIHIQFWTRSDKIVLDQIFSTFKFTK